MYKKPKTLIFPKYAYVYLIAHFDTILFSLHFFILPSKGANGKTSQNSIDLSFILWYHVLTKLEVVKVRVKELNKNFTTRLCLGMVW